MIFIDTGAFLARFFKRDQFHKKALNFWKKIEKEGSVCVTSNFILDETLTLLGRKTSYSFSAKLGKHLYSSELLIILRPESHHELEALKLFSKYSDHKISFTDCISCVLMKELNIPKVFSFDQHFVQLGFEVNNFH